MNKKNFDTLKEVEDFVASFLDEPKYIFDVQKNSEGKGFIVQWEEQKYYISQDGKTYPDEIWVTKDGTIIQIQDLDVEHLRNILRFLIRNDREYQKTFEMIMHKLQQRLMADSENEDEFGSNISTKSVTIH